MLMDVMKAHELIKRSKSGCLVSFPRRLFHWGLVKTHRPVEIAQSNMSLRRMETFLQSPAGGYMAPVTVQYLS
ncbi:hypothetical protein DPEC_G00051720 [Dallia pectoralis]|uniref:Uncharacterized protein n=1 Tax=Dallia pectoralis TaxID=75939 RepID=A0ACC2HC17_DALPE|nr:hypothetical protein DPEC_G00051720 [Dallia pectoralis]